MLLSLGSAYLLTGDYEKAIQELNNVKKLAPDNKLINAKLVAGYLKLKDLNKAKETIDRLIMQSPKDPNLYNFQAALYLIDKNKESALSPNIIARYRLAILLQKQKKNTLALEQYQAILSHEPENVLALNNLAWLLSEQGGKQALDYAKKAYELKPDSAVIN